MQLELKFIPEPSDIRRFGEMQRLVLERLQQGPATSTELAGITHRFGGRICELRKAGYVIERENMGNGVHRYTLKG